MEIITKTPVFIKIDKDECCGCEACETACPVNCISMQADSEGFLFPQSDLKLCINCGKCVKVCPVISSDRISSLKEVYAGYSSDEQTVKNSASGGAFSLIADAFLQLYGKNNTVICGVAWDDGFKSCHHVLFMGNEDYQPLRSSKYVQSKKEGIYNRVEEFLEKGKNVLFSGTPCEVAALRKVLKNDYASLYVVDIVCQGPTSPRAMSEYIAEREKKHNSRVKNVNMRYVHRTPWIPQWIKLNYDNGKKEIRVFYETAIGRAVHIMQRKSCYQCHFCGEGHVADITIGDYHGADPTASYYSPYGTSIVVINTEKGSKLFEEIDQEKRKFVSADYDQIAKTNPRLTSSWKPHKYRKEYGESFAENGLIYATRKSWSFRQRMRILLPYDLRMAVRKLRKKVSK